MSLQSVYLSIYVAESVWALPIRQEGPSPIPEAGGLTACHTSGVGIRIPIPNPWIPSICLNRKIPGLGSSNLGTWGFKILYISIGLLYHFSFHSVV
jgi:hypothetical protein